MRAEVGTVGVLAQAVRARNWSVAHITRGVAYAFWEEVTREAGKKGLNTSDLARITGLRRQTIDNLKTTTRPPQPRIINALADAVDIERDRAHILAGRLPPDVNETDTDVRGAIQQSLAYTEAQKQMLLEMMDALDAANAAQGHRTAS